MDNEEKEFSDELVKLFKVGLIFLGICLAALLGMYLYNFGSQGLSNQQEVWGQLGDFIGGLLNPVVGILTLCLLLLTVKLQRDMLRAAKRQVEVSEEELKKTSDALIEQNRAVAKQTFETTFFSMLSLWQKQASEIDIQQRGKIERGKDGFIALYKALRGFELRHLDPKIELEKLGMGPLSERDVAFARERIEQATFLDNWNELSIRQGQQDCLVPYLLLYYKHAGDLGHYYRTLFQILKYVDQSRLSMRDKRFYTNLVRAQFSPHEHALFFYNALSPFGIEKMMPLVEEYSLLKNLDQSFLLDTEHSNYCNVNAWSESPAVFNDELSATASATAIGAARLAD